VRLTRQLLLGSFLVISVLVVLVVVLSGQRLRAQLVDLVVGRLAWEARFVAAQWSAGVDPERLASSAGATLGHRTGARKSGELLEPARSARRAA